jgi:predicted Zn-dependent peptidase
VIMYHKHVLSNGLRVILVPQKNTKAISSLVLFKVGSRYETPRLSGAAHFIEHMMFKGTKRRPTTLDISRELDGMGAEYNAFTGKNLTGYFVKSASHYLSNNLDILSDMLFNSKFDQAEFKREKSVITEEIRMHFDNPLMHVEDMIEELVFKGSTLGRNIAGTEKTVSAMKRDEMLAFRDNFYNPKRAVVAVAGDIGDNALDLIKKHFVNFYHKIGRGKEFKIFKEKQIAARFGSLQKKTEQVQLAIGFPSYAYENKRLPALNLMSIIFGGTMSSRLFIEVRERRGLAYFVRSAVEPYEDTGMFLIRAGLNPTRLDEAIGVISAEILKLKKAGVTEAELNRAKKTVEGRMALDLEDSYAVASFFGHQEVLNLKLKTPEEKLAEIKKVTLRDIKEAAGEILNNQKISVAVISSLKKPLEVKKIKF